MSVQSSWTSRPAHSSRPGWVHSGMQIASVQRALCIYTCVMMCSVRGPNFQRRRSRSPELSCVVKIKSLTASFFSPTHQVDVRLQRSEAACNVRTCVQGCHTECILTACTHMETSTHTCMYAHCSALRLPVALCIRIHALLRAPARAF